MSAAKKRIMVNVDKDLEKLFPKFFRKRKEDILFFRVALKKGNVEAIKDRAHIIMGSSGSYDLDELGRIGEKIQEACKNQDMSSIKKFVSEYINYLEKVEIHFS